MAFVTREQLRDYVRGAGSYVLVLAGVATCGKAVERIQDSGGSAPAWVWLTALLGIIAASTAARTLMTDSDGQDDHSDKDPYL